MANQVLQQRSLSKTKINSWSHTDFEEYEFSHVWTISNYSDKATHNGNIILQSTPFSSQGRNEQWIMKLIPNRSHTDHGRTTLYTSVYLYLQEDRNENQSGNTNSPKMWMKYIISIPCSDTGKSPGKEIVHQTSSYVEVTKGKDFGSPTLVAKNILLNKDNGYLVNDTLTVYCMIFIKLLDTPKDSSGVISRVPVSEFSLSSKLNEDRQKGTSTDVTLVAGKKSFKAHRAVLALQSSFFNSRFQKYWDKGNNSVELPDITPETLENMLQFMYTGHCNISSNAETLLSAAQEYGVEILVRACEHKLSQEMNCQNVLSLLTLANKYGALHLKTVCLDFFVSHSSLILKSSEWEKFEKMKEHNQLRLEALDKLIKQKVIKL